MVNLAARHACRLLMDSPRPGAENMAFDEVLIQQSIQRAECAWRFYQWNPPTLSLGYFQPYAERQAHPASAEADVVRRASGGGAILHDRELTYSFVVPRRHPLAADPLTLYRQVHGSLVMALGELGVAVTISPRASGLARDEEPFLCFQRRAEGDVLLGDHKVGGSAQRRLDQGILQHGSVLLECSPWAPELPGIRELAGIPLPVEQLLLAWRAALERSLDLAFSERAWDSTEVRLADQLVAEKFGSPAWNECR